MNITYHKEVTTKHTDLGYIPHELLHPNIKAYIETLDVKQAIYQITCNGYYFFIYLDNGDRIDVEY